VGIKDKASEAASKTKRRIGMERPVAAEEGGRVGIVRGALQAFGSGDMDGFLDALKDDAPFECPNGENFPGAGEHEGPNEVKETFVADVGRTYTSFGFEPELFVEAEDDDAVIVFGSFVGEGAEGDNVDTRGVQVWEFKGNTVEAVRIYADTAEFPSVVSEEDLKKQEEEEKKAEEEDSDDSDDTEAKSDSDDSDDSDDDDDSKDDSDDDDQPKAESDSDDDDSDDDSDDKQRSDSNGTSGSDVELARAGDDQAEREKQETSN
jgi:ketosteroid isomerase-like protein